MFRDISKSALTKTLIYIFSLSRIDNKVNRNVSKKKKKTNRKLVMA